MHIQLIFAPIAVLCNFIEFTYMPLVLYFFSREFGNQNRRIHLKYIQSHASSWYSSLLGGLVESPQFARRLFTLIDFGLRVIQIYGAFCVVQLGALTLGGAYFGAILLLLALPLFTKVARLFWKGWAHVDSMMTTAVFIIALIYGYEGFLLSSWGHFDALCMLSLFLIPVHNAIITTTENGPKECWQEMIPLEKKQLEVEEHCKGWDDDEVHAQLADRMALLEAPKSEDRRYQGKIQALKRNSVMRLQEMMIPREIRSISLHITELCKRIEKVDPIDIGSIQEIFSHREDLEGIELPRLERDIVRYYTIKKNLPENLLLPTKQILAWVKPGILSGISKKLKNLQELYQQHFIDRVFAEHLSKMQNMVVEDIKNLSAVDMMLRIESLRTSLKICVQTMDPLTLSSDSREIFTILDIPILFNFSRKAIKERELLFAAPCAYLNESELKKLVKFYHENNRFF